MEFGRFLGGTLCAIGAVITAPVVLPTLGAAAAGTAAAAAGTAAVATAGATAAAAGLGVGVANAAGAVGLSTVAAVAGTTTGAAALEKLGKEKAKIWESFDRFVIMFSKIQKPPVMNANVDKESIALSAENLDNIKAVAVSVKELLSGGMGSVSAGGFIGMATSGGMLLNGKGKKSLEDAMGIDYETDLAVSKMNIAEKELKKFGCSAIKFVLNLKN